MVWIGKSKSLTQSGDILKITDLTAKKFNVFLTHEIPTGDADIEMTFNNNTNSVYARRTSFDGGVDGTAVTQPDLDIGFNPANDIFQIQYMCSISGEEKLGIIFGCKRNTAGATTAPRRNELVYKFVPSPDADVTRIDLNNANTGSYDTSSNLTVISNQDVGDLIE